METDAWKQVYKTPQDLWQAIGINLADSAVMDCIGTLAAIAAQQPEIQALQAPAANNKFAGLRDMLRAGPRTEMVESEVPEKGRATKVKIVESEMPESPKSESLPKLYSLGNGGSKKKKSRTERSGDILQRVVLEMLGDGVNLVAGKEAIRNEIQKKAGVSNRTMDRKKAELGIDDYPNGNTEGHESVWFVPPRKP